MDILNPEYFIPFLTLVVIELILGVDNILLITLLVSNLPDRLKARVRNAGMLLALAGRIALLFSIKWLVGLTNPVFTIGHFAVSWQNIILAVGGVYLIYKSVSETDNAMHHIEGHQVAVKTSIRSIVLQIIAMDAVFSIDSILTAVGIAEEITVMVAAVVIAVIIMMFLSGPIGSFIEKNLVVKLQALHFLFLVGFTLTLEGVHIEVPKEALYFAMGGIIVFEIWKTMIRKRVINNLFNRFVSLFHKKSEA